MSHYDTLGIGPTADESEIKHAYRRRAQETHPDKPGGDQDEFHAVALAYQVLSDPDRRARYDRTGDSEPAPSIETEIDAAMAILFMKIITAESPPANIVDASKKEVRGNQDRFCQQQSCRPEEAHQIAEAAESGRHQSGRRPQPVSGSVGGADRRG